MEGYGGFQNYEAWAANGFKPMSDLQSQTSVNDMSFGENGGGSLDAPNTSTSGLGTMGTMLGGVKALTGLGNLYLGYKGLGLAEDQFDYNKMARDRDYQANLTKYNNSVNRTKSVDQHYGLGTAAKPIG